MQKPFRLPSARRLATAVVLAACSLLAACVSPEAKEQDRAEATTGRVMAIVPVTIESDKAPGIGQVFSPKTANRPGFRIKVLNDNDKLVEVTQDDGAFKPGDRVRIEGFGSNAKIVRP